MSDTQQNKTSFVYSLVFRSRQFYIGSSNNPDRRYKEHTRKQPNRKVANVWKKFGAPKLVVLVECPAEEQKLWEQIVLDLAFNDPECSKSILNINRSSTRPYFSRFRKRKKRA